MGSNVLKEKSFTFSVRIIRLQQHLAGCQQECTLSK